MAAEVPIHGRRRLYASQSGLPSAPASARNRKSISACLVAGRGNDDYVKAPLLARPTSIPIAEVPTKISNLAPKQGCLRRSTDLHSLLFEVRLTPFQQRLETETSGFSDPVAARVSVGWHRAAEFALSRYACMLLYPATRGRCRAREQLLRMGAGRRAAQRGTLAWISVVRWAC